MVAQGAQQVLASVLIRIASQEVALQVSVHYSVRGLEANVLTIW